MSLFDEDALREAIAEGVRTVLRADLPGLLDEALARRSDDPLVYLADYLSTSTDAARMVEARRTGLRTLAVEVSGRRRKYRRSALDKFFAQNPVRRRSSDTSHLTIARAAKRASSLK